MSRITPADIEAAIASEHYFTAGDAIAPPVNKMVDRFLGWKLPQDFYPDCFIGFDRDAAQAHQSWPSGTSLLHAGQAKDMFEHAIGKPEVPQSLSLLTFCVLVLRNGHRVVGINYGPVDPALFSAETAREQAREEAIRQVWPLLGYELRTKLAAPVEGVLGDVRIVPEAGATPTPSPVVEELPPIEPPPEWKPTIGRIVTVKGPIANGTDEHPGMITRVFGAGEGALVNVTAFPDLSVPKVLSSIPAYPSRAAARDAVVGPSRANGYAFFPDREGGQ